MSTVNYGIYTIQCLLGSPTPVDSGYLHVPDASRAPKAPVTQYSWSQRRVTFTDHFEFVLIEDGSSGDSYYIVNRRSGLCLCLPSVKEGERLIQDTYRPDHDKDYRFILEPVEPDQTDPKKQGSYRLVSAASGHVLLVDGAIPKNGQAIRAFPEAGIPIERKHHIFEFTPITTEFVAPPAGEPVREESATRRPPRLTALDQYLPDSVSNGNDVVLDRAIVPFFAVNDPVLACYRQVELSPYYTIEQSLRWDKVSDRTLDGHTTRETQLNTTVGMTQFDASTVRNAFHWSVEASVEASYNGAAWSGSATLSTTIGGEVEKTNQHSAESRVDRSTTETITYPALGHPYRIVTWMPVDVFEIRAHDGRVVHEWSVPKEHEEAIEFLPESQTAADDATGDTSTKRRAR